MFLEDVEYWFIRVLQQDVTEELILMYLRILINQHPTSSILHRLSHHPIFYNKGAITKETTAINLTTIFNAGPDVSLNGSPTVSPQIAAL